MLHLSDFVALYNLSRVLCISASKHCRNMKFRTHIHLTLVSKMNENEESQFGVDFLY